MQKNNGNFIYNGLDRINSMLLHNLNNIVPCCKLCNYLKRSLSLEKFSQLIYTFYTHLIVNNFSPECLSIPLITLNTNDFRSWIDRLYNNFIIDLGGLIIFSTKPKDLLL